MDRRVLMVAVVLLFARAARASEMEVAAPESGNDQQEPTSNQEWEANDVIPPGGVTVSTEPITPITNLQEKNPYDQSLAELAIAQDLWGKGKSEAASDVALEAYDDLMSISLHRRNKKNRQKLRGERHQAATVYIESSIACIQDYVKRNGDGRRVLEEGRARLGDLRDVSQNYPELTKKVTMALDAYSVDVSTR